MLEEKIGSETTLDMLDEIDPIIEIICGTENKKKYEIRKKLLAIGELFNASFENDHENRSFEFPGILPETFAEMIPYFEHHYGIKGQIIPPPAKSKKMIENLFFSYNLKNKCVNS